MTNMSTKFWSTLEVVRNEIVDVSMKVNLTMRAMANQASVGGAILVDRKKIPEPKPFCRAIDVKTLENFIFNL